MATSGTFNSGRYGGGSYGPWLTLAWTQVSQSVANNSTTLDLTLRFHWDQRINYTFRSRTGSVQGNSYTYSGSASGTSGVIVLKTQRVTIPHNSNGTKSITLSANITNLGINWSNSNIGTMTVGGVAYLEDIPRGSTLSAFSFASSLQVGTKVNINYTVARHSSNYRHQVQLRDGSVTVATWDNQSSNGSSSVELTGTQVNTLLGRMSTVTSKSFTLRVATRSGINGGFIGNAVTRNATVSVNGNVEPTISSTSVAPIGNSWAVGKGFYVQGQTGVRAQFYGSAIGGAGVKSRSISIGNLSSGGAIVDGVFRHSQTRVNATGNITITYKITDTRDRSTISTRTINFRAYTPPQITSFSVGRASPTSSTVSVKSKGSIHGMGGQNTGTMTVRQKGVTSPVRTLSLSNTTPSFDDSFNRTVATSTSTDFTITVTDSLGNSATSTSKVGTAFMEFSIRKGTGVGIGKVHERGVLDVDGDAYFKGRIIADRTAVYYPHSNEYGINNYNDITTEWSLVGATTAMRNAPPNVSDEIGGSGSFVYLNTMHYSDNYKKQIAYGYTSNQVWTRYSYGGNWSNWVEIGGRSGSNSNGLWFRLSDGLQICIMYITPDRRTSALQTRAFPLHFSGDVVLAGTWRNGSASDYNESNASLQISLNQNSANVDFRYQFLRTTNTGYNWWIRVVAIGRWF